MTFLENLISFLIFINTVFAIYTVFKEKRDISSTLAWLLVLVLLPGVGFFFYMFFGRKISKEQIFDLQTQRIIGIENYVQTQQAHLTREAMPLSEELQIADVYEMIHLFLQTSNSPLTMDNAVKVYTDGRKKFKDLLEDLEQATSHIYIMYYIFRYDKLGKRVIDILERKAAAGVKVSLLYDSLGSRGMKERNLEQLRKNGGQVLHSLGNDFSLFNTNVNFRNHRKIVVIDSKVGYVGGFNVGDDYLGEYENMGYWRDTHIRVEGSAVLALQAQFVMDWNASTKDKTLKETSFDTLLPTTHFKGDVLMQIVASGPDSEMEINKKGYLKMISLADKYIYIQTPYFIPDEPVLESLLIAIASGIDVKIMIPNKPDHPFIYRATLWYAREIVEAGGEVYIYDNGFLHSKTVVVDGLVSSIGTANFDIRSFRLNFEINAYIYDEKIAKQNEIIFMQDIKKSYLLTNEIIQNNSLWEKVKQSFSRLLSPLL